MAERQSAQMSNITNDGLTLSLIGCFIVHMAPLGVKGLTRPRHRRHHASLSVDDVRVFVCLSVCLSVANIDDHHLDPSSALFSTIRYDTIR